MVHHDFVPSAFRRKATLIVCTVFGATALLLSSCSSTKTAVGEGLLTDITGQVSRRDTLEYALSASPALSHASVPIHLSSRYSERLLVGEANGLRATMLLKFAPLPPWQETRTYSVAGVVHLDTLTITPVAIETDSASEMSLTFAGFVTDSNRIALTARISDFGWSDEDSVTTALPSFGEPLFTGITPDSVFPGDVINARIPPAALSPLINDTLSIAVQGGAGTPMHSYSSREGIDTFSPQISLWVRAAVESRRTDIPAEEALRDTAVGLILRPITDVYRLERLAPMPSPPSDVIFLAGGAAWRGYLRFNRFDIPGLSVDGVVPKETTVNSAILELTVGTGQYSFQSDAAHLEIHPLTEAFDYGKMQANEISVDTFRGNSGPFSSLEARADSSNVRRFQIADLVNTWWHDSTANKGLLINVNATTTFTSSGIGIEEDRRVDAVEVTGVRLIVTTTLPPVFVKKPARADSADNQREGAQ